MYDKNRWPDIRDSYQQCWPFRIAPVLAGIAPRGKDAIPRFVGGIARPWIYHAFVTRHGGLKAGDYSSYSVKCVSLTRQELMEKGGSHRDILAIPARRRSRFSWFADELRAGTIDMRWEG